MNNWNRSKIIEMIQIIGFNFAWITALMVFANALYITVFYGLDISVPSSNYWYILLVSFLLALITNLFFSKQSISGKKGIILVILNYIVVNLTVITTGILCHWFDPNKPFMLIGMLVLIALIYCMVFTINSIKGRREAKLINERLRQLEMEDPEEK